MKQSTLAYLAVSLFALCGLVCGIVSLKLSLDRQRLIKEGILVIGTIVNLNYSSPKGDTTVAPVISYTTKTGENLIYYSNIYTGINPPQIGDKRKLWYDPSNPRKVTIEKEGLFLILLLLLFFVTHGTVGFGGLIWLLRQRRMFKLLKESGRTIQTRYERTKTYWWTKGRPKSIVSSWTDPKTQITYKFFSQFILENQNLSPLENSEGIPVIINPQNPKQYWVDLPGLGIKVYT